MRTLITAARHITATCVTYIACMLLPLCVFASEPVAEHELKAAILFRVAKFVEWPARAFETPNSPFVMCVIGDERSLRAFDMLSGKQMGDHPVIVRRITGDMLDLRQCHAAFFPNDAIDVDYALRKIAGAPVLTVGETAAFVDGGGALALQTEEQRVTFAINLRASKDSGLTVSSQLLQIAEVIGHSPH